MRLPSPQSTRKSPEPSLFFIVKKKVWPFDHSGRKLRFLPAMSGSPGIEDGEGLEPSGILLSIPMRAEWTRSRALFFIPMALSSSFFSTSTRVPFAASFCFERAGSKVFFRGSETDLRPELKTDLKSKLLIFLGISLYVFF